MTAFGRVVVLLFVLALAGLGWLSYTVLTRSTESRPPEATSTQSAVVSSIIPDVPDESYTNTTLSFSMQYPSIATSSAVGYEGYLPLTKTPLKSFVLPRSLFEGTNLSEAGVYVGATTTPEALSACTASAPLPGETALGSTTINDADFWTYSSEDVAAGNIYSERIYRRLENGWCVEIVALLHSGQIANYPPGAVSAFDRTKYQGILDAIVHTYRSIPTGI